jgi:thiamine-phosphate pyrophosphorylase
MKKISRLQYITTNAALAEQACKGGVDWIQLRLKGVTYDEYLAAGREVQAVCKKYNATFIINDSPRLALALNADGVHVGKADPLLQEDIDELLSKGCIIGCTANTIEDLIHLSGKAVSYIGLGPYRFTTTKENLSPVLGIEGYKRIFAAIKDLNLTLPPVLGIGGITLTDVAGMLDTGLYGVAVSGAISKSTDVIFTASEFSQQIISYNLLQKETI